MLDHAGYVCLGSDVVRQHADIASNTKPSSACYIWYEARHFIYSRTAKTVGLRCVQPPFEKFWPSLRRSTGVQKHWAARFQTITLCLAPCSDSKCSRDIHRLSAIIAPDHVLSRSNYRLHSKASRSCGGAGIGVKHCRVPFAKAAGRRNYAHRGLRCEACSATQITRDDRPWWPCLARRPRCNTALYQVGISAISR